MAYSCTLTLTVDELTILRNCLRIHQQSLKESISDLEKCSDESEFGKSLVSDSLSYHRNQLEITSGFLDRVHDQFFAPFDSKGGEADEK